MANFLDYLQKEGIDPSSDKAQFLSAIYGQESGGGRNTKTSNQGAVGGMQIIPSTFKTVADKDWSINNPEQSARAGIRYGSNLYDKYGAERAAVGYYSGEGGVEAYDKGVYYKDKKNPNAPNTKEYAQSVLNRMGGGGAGGSGTINDDDSFESFIKTYKPKESQQPTIQTNPVKDEDSFENFIKTYKPTTVTKPTVTPETNTLGFIGTSTLKGLAGNVDAIINTPENLANLGMAGIGYLGGELGVPEKYLPEVKTPTNLVSETLRDKGIISNAPEVNPTTPEGRIADLAIQSATGGIASKGNILKNMATGATLGTGIGTAIEAGVEPTTAVGLGLIAPLAVKGAIGATAKGVSALGKQVPYYTKARAEQEAANRILQQSGTEKSPQEFAGDIENKLVSGKELHTTGELLGINKLREVQGKQATKDITLSNLAKNTEEWKHRSNLVNQDVIDTTKKVFNTKPGTGGFISTKNKLYEDNTERGLESNILFPDKEFEPHNITKIFNASNTPEELVDNLFIKSGVKDINLKGIKSLVKDGVITKQQLVKTIQEGIIDTNSTNPQVNTVRLNNILSDPSNTKTINYLLGEKKDKVALKNMLQTNINERSSITPSSINSTSKLDVPVENLLNTKPILASGLAGGAIGLATGNPILGVLGGILGKSVTSNILEKLTIEQNSKLQAAITHGLLDPKHLANTLKGMKPEQAKTTLVEKLNNIQYTVPAINKLTQQKE